MQTKEDIIQEIEDVIKDIIDRVETSKKEGEDDCSDKGYEGTAFEDITNAISIAPATEWRDISIHDSVTNSLVVCKIRDSFADRHPEAQDKIVDIIIEAVQDE